MRRLLVVSSFGYGHWSIAMIDEDKVDDGDMYNYYFCDGKVKVIEIWEKRYGDLYAKFK